MSTELAVAFSARMLQNWINVRFETNFGTPEASGNTFIAADSDRKAGIFVASLWDEDEGWNEHLAKMEARLDSSGGAYLLWVPPGATVPHEEPDASDFVQRVQAAIVQLPPSARTEVMFPVDVKLAKVREEGGYASVIGGLNRWWTRITENVTGTFHVDSSKIHRLTMDGESREKLWSDIGSLSHSVDVGQSAEFEVNEAWTLHRLADDGATGLAIVGAPPNVDPTDGIGVRRNVRKRLAVANEALGGMEVDLRVVGLVGAYEYAELETAGSTVKAVSADLFNRIEVIAVLADGEVKPTFVPKALPWAS